MRPRIVLAIAVIGIIILAVGLTGTTKKVVRLAGSTAFLPFAEQLAEDYMITHPDVSVDVQGGGSATGVMAALAGIVDIGMVDLLTLP
jgi:phosphate transport system substrate-binding protein